MSQFNGFLGQFSNWCWLVEQRRPVRGLNFENHFSKNRLDDAEKIVVKAAETNGKQLKGPIFVSEEDKNEDAPKKNACSDFLAMFGDIWNVISGEIHIFAMISDDSTLKLQFREFPKTSSSIFVSFSHLDDQFWILLWSYIEC